MKNRIDNCSIVPTTLPYSSTLLNLNLNSLKSIYPFLEMRNIGVSAFGKSIPYVRIGTGDIEVFYNASFHANEWITSNLLMKFIERFCCSYTNGDFIYGFDPNFLFNHVSLYIVPMVNPDGVDLVTGELSPSSTLYQQAKNISSEFPDIPFPSGWKANLQGVDLKIYQPNTLYLNYCFFYFISNITIMYFFQYLNRRICNELDYLKNTFRK